jgi:hypothetical protein
LKQFDFTFDEVMGAIREISNGDGKKGFTVAQMVQQSGYNANWCREKLRGLIDSGRVRCAGKINATTIDGRTCKIPLYQLVDNGS